MDKDKRKKQARILRVFRKVHRLTGALLFVFFFIIALTGLLLGWKKNSFGYLQAPTEKGIQPGLQGWMPLDSLERIAVGMLKSSEEQPLSPEIDRLDVRPEKGIVKVIFANHYQSYQLDGRTGQVLRTETRLADLIEHIHDGTIVDRALKIPEGIFKLVYTTVMGLALILFTVTGFWLWYGPKRMRRDATAH